jgi:hypothetical protein
MGATERPETFHIDLTGGNGTPFRFVFLPDDGSVWQYDRRHTIKAPDQTHPNFNDDGQLCGGTFAPSDFIGKDSGIRGWHEVDAWDIDRATVRMVGIWLTHIANAYGLDLS